MVRPFTPLPPVKAPICKEAQKGYGIRLGTQITILGIPFEVIDKYCDNNHWYFKLLGVDESGKVTILENISGHYLEEKYASNKE